MPRYQYAMMTWGASSGGLVLDRGGDQYVPLGSNEVLTHLNRLGSEGWELVATDASPDRYWLRREVE